MADDLRYKIGLDGSEAQSTLKGLLGGVSGLGTALTGLGAAAGLTALVRRGMEFNQTMADSEVAIGNVLQQMAGLNAEAAKAEAAKAMQQMVELEPKASGSLTDLVNGFMATLGASQSAGMSVKENIDLVGRFSNALANSNIHASQLAQEMRSIVTGTIGADSSLAKVLSISNDDINKARAAGNLYEFLVGKIGKLGEAGDTAGVAFSTLQSAVDKAAGAMTRGLFEKTVAGSKSLTAALADSEQAFVALGQAGGMALGGVLSLLQALGGPLKATLETIGKIGEGFGYIAGVAMSVAEGFTLEEAMEAARKTGEELRQTMRGAGQAAEQAGDAGAQGMKKIAAAAETAAKKVQQAAAGPETQRGDRDGDGIISKREQRKLDLEEKRAMQKANALKGFSGKRLGLDLGFGGLDAAGLGDAIHLTGKNEGKKAFANLFDIGGTAALKKLRASGGDVVQGALARLRGGEDVAKGLGQGSAFALPKAAVRANLQGANANGGDAKAAAAAQEPVIDKLDELKLELARIRTT